LVGRLFDRGARRSWLLLALVELSPGVGLASLGRLGPGTKLGCLGLGLLQLGSGGLGVADGGHSGGLAGLQFSDRLVAGAGSIVELFAELGRLGLGAIPFALRGGDSFVGLQLRPLRGPLRSADLRGYRIGIGGLGERLQTLVQSAADPLYLAAELLQQRARADLCRARGSVTGIG